MDTKGYELKQQLSSVLSQVIDHHFSDDIRKLKSEFDVNGKSANLTGNEKDVMFKIFDTVLGQTIEESYEKIKGFKQELKPGDIVFDVDASEKSSVLKVNGNEVELKTFDNHRYIADRNDLISNQFSNIQGNFEKSVSKEVDNQQEV